MPYRIFGIVGGLIRAGAALLIALPDIILGEGEILGEVPAYDLIEGRGWRGRVSDFSQKNAAFLVEVGNVAPELTFLTNLATRVII